MNDTVGGLATILFLLLLFWIREKTLPPLPPEKQIFTVTLACKAETRDQAEQLIGRALGMTDRGCRIVAEEGETAYIEAVKRAYP